MGGQGMGCGHRILSKSALSPQHRVHRWPDAAANDPPAESREALAVQRLYRSAWFVNQVRAGGVFHSSTGCLREVFAGLLMVWVKGGGFCGPQGRGCSARTTRPNHPAHAKQLEGNKCDKLGLGNIGKYHRTKTTHRVHSPSATL